MANNKQNETFCKILKEKIDEISNEDEHDLEIKRKYVYYGWVDSSLCGVVSLLMAHFLTYILKNKQSKEHVNLWSQIYNIADVGKKNPYGLIIFIVFSRYFTKLLRNKIL